MKYFCEYIHNAISFNRTDWNSLLSRITFCNFVNTSNGLGRAPLLEDYDGSKIDWDALFDKRSKIQEDFENGIFPKQCEGCYRITQLENPNRKLTMLSIAAWQLCNSRCIYCEAEYLNDYEKYYDTYENFSKKFIEQYDVLEVVKYMIKHNMLEKNALIDITGGEPTLYPKFNEMLALLLEYGCNNIRVLSNTIVHSPVIERGLKMNAITMIISLDAGSFEMHKKVKGVASYHLIWENIKRYATALPKNSNHDIDLKYILIEGVNDNKKELDIWLKKTKESGATCASINIRDQLLQKVEIDKKIAKKTFDLVDFAIKKAKKYNIKFYLHGNLEDLYKKFDKPLPIKR